MTLPVIPEGSVGLSLDIAFRDVQGGIDVGPLDLSNGTIVYRFASPIELKVPTFDRTAFILGDPTDGLSYYLLTSTDAALLLAGSPWEIQGYVTLGPNTLVSEVGFVTVTGSIVAP